MKKTIFFSMLAAVLIGVMSVWFSSCSKDHKGEEKISFDPILGKWDHSLTTNYIEFKKDNTYSLFKKNEIINGLYKITESEKTEYSYTGMYYNHDGSLYEETRTFDATLHKMLVSGSADFDRMWVYHYQPLIDFPEIYQLVVILYYGNDLVEKIVFVRD